LQSGNIGNLFKKLPVNTVYDAILRLKSLATGRYFHTVEFSGDTDMATAGWVSLTSMEKTEIVVTTMTAEEYQGSADGSDTGYLMNERRMNAVLKRSDLRCCWLVSAEEQNSEEPTGSFQEFLKSYRPPRLFYRDIFSFVGRAKVDARLTRKQFEDAGGLFSVR